LLKLIWQCSKSGVGEAVGPGVGEGDGVDSGTAEAAVAEPSSKEMPDPAAQGIKKSNIPKIQLTARTVGGIVFDMTSLLLTKVLQTHGDRSRVHAELLFGGTVRCEKE
jgi:hypothetical protein